MSTDLYKQVLYNDGEGITHGDLNDSQRFLSAELFDQVLEKFASGLGLSSQQPEFFNNAATHLAYCLHGGQAYLRKGSGNNKLQISPGTLLQKVGSSDGNAPTFLAYTFAGTEEVTIANGGGVNPRVDILQMKLELVDGDSQSRDFKDATTGVVTTTSMNKKRRVQCTLSVKQGTAAASPVYPDPDSGYVAVAGIVVMKSYAGGAMTFGSDGNTNTDAYVHDQRMPLRVRAHGVPAADYWLITAYALSADKTKATQSAGTNVLHIPCPNSSIGRIVGVTIPMDTGTGDAHFVGQSPFGNTLKTTVNGSLPNTSGREDHNYPYWSFEGLHEGTGGPVIQQSATNKIGPPVWTNSLRCVVPPDQTVPGFAFVRPTILEINDTSAPGDVYSHTIFYIAEGI